MLERSPEAKSWWQGLKDMIAEAWRGMVRGLSGKGAQGIDWSQMEGMKPEEGMEWLVEKMASGERIAGEGQRFDFASRGGAEARRVPTAEVKDTGDGTLRFQIVRNGHKKTYKRPEEALRDFIAELEGMEMDAEQQGIYDVATGGRKTTDIRKDDLGNLIKLHKGNRGKGAQKIIAVHYAGKRGKVTAKEVIDMGMVIREGKLTYDGTPEHPASRRYEMLAEDGARLRVVVDLDKQGNEAVINLYSDRKDGNPGHKASSGAETTSREEPANQAAGATEDGHAALTGERSRTVLHSTAPGKGSSDGANYSTSGGAAQGGAEIRYSRKVAAVEDGEVEKSLDAIIGKKVKRTGGRSLAVKERKGEEGKIRSAAQEVFKTLKDERIPLPNGGELYFAPDERTVEAYGGNVPDAWAEYCIHLVTHGVTNAETGKRYRAYSETNVAKVLPEIRETVAANQVSIDEKGERVIFYRQKEKGASNSKSRFQKLVAEIDANGDLRIDLRYITGMERRGRIPGRLTTLEDALASGPTQGGATTDASSSVLPGDTATLKEVISDRTAEGHALHQDQTGADYSTGGEAAQGGSNIRYQRRLTDAESATAPSELRRAEKESEREERALKAVREGRVRVADNGAAAGERSEAGQAASAELLRAQSAPCEDRSLWNPVSFSMSQLLGMYRAIRSNPALPRVLQEAKRRGAAWVSRITKGSDVELNPEAFAVVDRTDREAVKQEMIEEGMFRNEDPIWNMKHSKAQCENERKLSEMRLEDRLHTLAEKRRKGELPGGDRAAANAFAHEIGQLVMAMPMSEGLRSAAGKKGAAALRDLKTVGEGLTKALEKEWSEAEKKGRKDGEWDERLATAGHLRDAVNAVAWWRGTAKGMAELERIAEEKGEEGLKAVEEEENRAKAALAKDQKGLAGELFGMFLAAPETLRERAPRGFNRIVEAIGANETLLKAYSRIASADAPTEVMAKIEERQTVEAMSETRRLKKDLQSALGTRWEKMKLAVARGIWSRESPALMRIRWKATEEIALAKEALKLAKKGKDREEIRQAERNLELAKRSAKEAVDGFRHEIITKHRNGGAGLNYMNQLDSRVLGTLARGGLEVKDLDRYLKCRNVIANQGKAMDFGITPQEANRALEAQRSDLGEEKWAVLERAAKEFHENRERNILDDENVKEMIGERRIARWKLNSSYVRNERTLTAEEVAELNEAQYEPLTEKTKARFRKRKETKNWELLTDPVNVARMKAVEVDIESASIGGSAERLENRTLRARLKEIFAGFGLCKNAETGSEVEFPGNAAGKMLSQSGADMSALAPHLKALFEGATAAWYEPEMRMEGHTFHADVKGYRNYINRFSTKDGTEWYIRFTVRENKGANGRNDVHAATVSDVRLYKNTGATILVNKTSRSSGAFVDGKISHFLSGVKTDRAVDVVKEMDALIKMHQTKGVMGGERFLKPLVGSFRPTEAPTEATAMHDMSLLEYARQNHYVAALAEYATKMKLKGFAVVRDMRYKGVNAGDRYGTRAFMKDGDKVGWNYVAFSDEHIRVDHKWTDGQIRYSRKLKAEGKKLKGKTNLSRPENVKALRKYVKIVEPAEMPTRLADGSPKTALEWFEANMVGKTFAFEIPGYGHREFTPKVGHIGRFTCKGGTKQDGTKIIKGRIAKAGGDVAKAFEMVRGGEIKASDIEGWDVIRAKSLPLVPEVFRAFDFAMHEKDTKGNDIIVLAKKFTNKKGRPNVIVMKLIDDKITIGPLSARVGALTDSWLKRKDLLLTDEGEVYNGSANNSATRTPLEGDNAESNSPKSTHKVSQEGEEVKGG